MLLQKNNQSVKVVAMLRIRLQRIGKRNKATFRIVVTEHTRAPKSGDYIERLGSWNPHSDEVILKSDRIKHWISVGAQPTDVVYNLLVKNGVIEGKAKNVLPKKTPIVKEGEGEAEQAQESQGESQAQEEQKEEQTEAEVNSEETKEKSDSSEENKDSE